MARPGVEYDAVERIARQLISKGQHPSVQKVRDILGTGSNTTIANHLKTWQASFNTRTSPTLPESVPEDLMNPLDDFWALAVAKAESKYQKFKEELETKFLSAEAAKQETQRLLNEKISESERLQHDLSSTENKLSETEQILHNLEGKYSVVQHELTYAQTTVEQTHALLQEQNLAFQEECEQIRKEYAEAQVYERERATKTEAMLLNEIDQLRQMNGKLENEQKVFKKDYSAKLEQGQQSEAKLNSQLSELSSRYQQLETIEKQARDDVSDLKALTSVTQNQLSKSLDTIEALRISLEASQKREKILLQKLKRLDAKKQD